jgi:5-methylcytosine-specific restriction endonuclease McrA
VSSSRNRILLDIIATDKTFEQFVFRGQTIWNGKCIHCNRNLMLCEDGKPISKATIEHIVPLTHGGGDDIKNLAIACESCNNLKGRTLDIKKRGHPQLEKVIASLQEKRIKRWK